MPLTIRIAPAARPSHRWTARRRCSARVIGRMHSGSETSTAATWDTQRCEPERGEAHGEFFDRERGQLAKVEVDEARRDDEGGAMFGSRLLPNPVPSHRSVFRLTCERSPISCEILSCPTTSAIASNTSVAGRDRRVSRTEPRSLPTNTRTRWSGPQRADRSRRARHWTESRASHHGLGSRGLRRSRG